MKWFKHDANAILDSKIKRLRLKYGMEGYGLYWYCLECIARNVEKHNLTFVLEEDSELISADTGIGREKIEDMMTYMVNIGLFEESSGIVTCLKMATRTDEYTQKLIKDSNIVPIISGDCPDNVRVNRREENRREEKRESKKKKPRPRFIAPTVEEVRDYCRERSSSVDPVTFVDWNESKGWRVGNQPMKDWKAAVRTWEARDRSSSKSSTTKNPEKMQHGVDYV